MSNSFDGMTSVSRDDVVKAIARYDVRKDTCQQAFRKAKRFLESCPVEGFWRRLWFSSKNLWEYYTSRHEYLSKYDVAEIYAPQFFKAANHKDVFDSHWGFIWDSKRNQLDALVKMGRPEIFVSPAQARFIRKFNKMAGL